MKLDHSLACWGDSSEGAAQPPAGSDYASVGAGTVHACALRIDHSLACWGNHQGGSATPPPGNDYASLAVGAFHNCAVKIDHSLACWGEDDYGQATPPVGTDYLSVSSGHSHSCAVKADHSLACWGTTADGQATPPTGTDFESVGASSDDTCAVRTDHSLVCWGAVGFGGQTTPPSGTDFASVSNGSAAIHSCAVKIDHTVACWGDNSFGETDVPLIADSAHATYGDASAPLRAVVGGSPNEGAIAFSLASSDPLSGDVAAGVASVSYPITGLNAGNYTIRAAYTDPGGAFNPRVNSHQAPGAQLIISKALQLISFTPPSGLVYGGSAAMTSATSSAGLPVTVTVTTPTYCKIDGGSLVALKAGGCTLKAAAAGDLNHKAATLTVKTPIARAPLTITASSGSFVRGDPVPAVTPTYDGLVNGDTPGGVADPRCTTPATSASKVGQYPTSCATSYSSNYTVTRLKGTMTVTAAPAARAAP